MPTPTMAYWHRKSEPEIPFGTAQPHECSRDVKEGAQYGQLYGYDSCGSMYPGNFSIRLQKAT